MWPTGRIRLALPRRRRRPQIEAQRSGFDLERRRDEMSELCPPGRSEGYGVHADDVSRETFHTRLRNSQFTFSRPTGWTMTAGGPMGASGPTNLRGTVHHWVGRHGGRPLRMGGCCAAGMAGSLPHSAFCIPAFCISPPLPINIEKTRKTVENPCGG